MIFFFTKFNPNLIHIFVMYFEQCIVLFNIPEESKVPFNTD